MSQNSNMSCAYRILVMEQKKFTEMIPQDRFIGLVLLMLRLSQSRIIIFSSKPKDCKSPVFVLWCQNL